MKQKILVFSDLHGSFNALQSLQQSDDWKTADTHIFLGDVVVGFSRPNECINLLKEQGCICLLGNNDDYVANKIPQADISSLPNDKIEHIKWMCDNVSPDNKQWLLKLPKDYSINFNNKTLYFTHYPWEVIDGEFSVIDSPLEKNLTTRQKMFANVQANYVFFGHEHKGSVFGDKNCTYVCVDAIGQKNPAEYCVINLSDNNIDFEKKYIEFDLDEEIELMFAAGYPFNQKKYKKTK